VLLLLLLLLYRPASADSWDGERRLDVCLTAICLHLLGRNCTSSRGSHKTPGM